MRYINLTRAACMAVFAGAMVMASAAFGAPGPSLVSETAVATSTAVSSAWSDVYKSKVVYGERNSVSYDIWLYDAATGSKKAIAASRLGEYRPRIWGDYVVYNRDQVSIHLYRISTGKTKTIAAKHAESTVVDIYRDKVVYSKYSTVTKTNDIYIYDIDTGKESKIISSTRPTGYADDRVQALWGNNLIYVVNYSDLRVYNLSTKKSASLGAVGYSIDSDYANAGLNRPAIYQNTVVYTAPVSGYQQVFAYDLGTQVRTQISQDATNHAAPAIYSTRVIYDTGSIVNKELVAYDLRTNKSWNLNIGKSLEASIWGDRLAWTDVRNGTIGDEHDEGVDWGNKDVYTGTLKTLKFAVHSSMIAPYNSPVYVSVKVTKPDGSSVDTGTVLGYQTSTNGVTWSDETTFTALAGRASFTLPPIASKRYVRYTYDGTPEVPSTVGPVFTVTPRVAVGTPVAPETMKEDKSYSIYGTLRPQHSGGTVRIYKYKKVSGKWKSYGYTTARVYKYSTYSRYRGNVKLTSKGAWRLRAYENADSKHAATWSPYEYVKAN